MTIATPPTEDRTASPAGASNLGTPQGELALRFLGNDRDGQVVRLDGEKCSIGSGEFCTPRVQGRGVHPTHCLLLRGTHGTVVRRWSPDTRLNALLKDGHRLSIASIEFDVLSEESADNSDRDDLSNERFRQLTARLEELQEQSRHLERQHTLDLENWQQEKARLKGDLQTAA